MKDKKRMNAETSMDTIRPMDREAAIDAGIATDLYDGAQNNALDAVLGMEADSNAPLPKLPFGKDAE